MSVPIELVVPLLFFSFGLGGYTATLMIRRVLTVGPDEANSHS